MPSRTRRLAHVVLVLLGAAVASSADAQPANTPGQVIHSFDAYGDVEDAGLAIGRDGRIYGTRGEDGDFSGGTIFRLEVTGSGFEVLHHFGDPATADAGVSPSGPMVEATSGVFYGTTTGGGTDGWGTLFRLDTTVSPATVTVVHSFGAGEGAPRGGVILASDGLLYGAASSTFATPDVVYRIATDGTSYQALRTFPGSDTDPTDPGRAPQGVIEGRDGLLYGTTWNGPDLLRGKVFRMATDGTQFAVLAEAPGQIIGPPVEIESGGYRWIYAITGVGPGTFPGGAPDGSLFRVLADGSMSETVHALDATRLDVGAPPVGRLLVGPGAGLYGITSFGAGACVGGFGCGSVYRAQSSPYPLHVFQSQSDDGLGPLGAMAQSADGRLFVLTASGGQNGLGTIYVVNHPATDPLIVGGPSEVQTMTTNFGMTSYQFSVAHRNGSTSPLTNLQVHVDPSFALLPLPSEPSGDGWSCVRPDPNAAQYTCTWNGSLNPGDATPTHTMAFLVNPFGGFASTCGTAPTPCVTFPADLASGNTVLASATVTTTVTVIHPNTGLPNTAPIANDDSVTVIGTDPVNIRVVDNDYSNPAENDVLSIEILTQPLQGYASPGGSLTIDYVPNAPLTGPDTFQYRLTDTFGASDIATVTLSPPQTFTPSKTFIDIGRVRQGELASARVSIAGPANAGGLITFEPVPAAEIASLFQQNGSAHDPLATVFDPDAFRPHAYWDPGRHWDTSSVAWIDYRAPAVHPPGRVSVVRAVFTDALTGTVAGSVVLVGENADPFTGPPHAVDDSTQTAVDTPITTDVTANDIISTSGQPLHAGGVSYCANQTEVIFDGAACVPVGGAILLGVGAAPGDITYTPPAGFTGTVTFPYASGDLPACWDSRPACREETTLYWAGVTVDVGGVAPPNLVATKAILHQFALVSAIEAVNGDTVVFRIGAVNQPPPGGTSAGPTTAPITITDTLPAGLAFVPAQSDARCSASGQVVTCTTALVLNQGDGVTFDITATVVANPNPGESVALFNEAVASTAAEITTSDNISPYVQVLVRGPIRADLALSIAPGAPSVATGSPITVAATITNLGDNAVSHVIFSGFASLTGFDQISIAPAANCPVPAPGAPLVCTFPFLAVNASQVVTFTGTPQVASPLVQAAGTVSSPETDPNTANNSASAAFVVTASLPPNLRATKAIVTGGAEASTITVMEGAQVQFRIGAINADATTAGSTTGPITVTDTLPAAFTSAVSVDGRCAVAGHTVTCVSNDVLSPGRSVTFDFVATTATGVAGDGSSIEAQNQATATTPGDTTTADNVSPAVVVTILGPRRADLAVTMQAAPTSLLVGEDVTFTATVTNIGPNHAAEPRLRWSSAFTSRFSIQSVGASEGTCGVVAGPQIECSMPDLPPGVSIRVVVTATPTLQVFENTQSPQVNVDVSASAMTVTTDPVQSNNEGTVTVTVARPQADVAVTLATSSSTVAVGQPITATATVVNNGPQVATGVDLIGFYPPSNFTNIIVTSSPGTTCQVVQVPTERVTCPIGTLVPGGTATVSYTGTTVSPSASESLAVQVSSVEADPNGANNAAAATFAVTNTPVSPTPVTVSLETSAGTPVPVTVTFSAVTAGGQTVANPMATPPAVPSGFQGASVAYDISTTATYTPPVTVCIDGSFGANDYLLHYENGAWVQLPNQQRLPVGGPPFTRVCADTATFSPFVVATRVNRAPTVEAGPNQFLEATSPAGAMATVSAMASDPDGDTLTYTWSGTCGTASGATASLLCPIGDHRVTLSVSDGQHPPVTDRLGISVHDSLAPTITVTSPMDDDTYAVGQAVIARFSCTDGGSGVQACTGSHPDGAALPTDMPGTFTFTAHALDRVGNATSRSVTYTVRSQTFTFTGFFGPVVNAPAFNRVKAGRAVPVTFGLGGDQGLSVFAAGFPRAHRVACDSGVRIDGVEESVPAGTSGLQYDPGTGRYTLVWKTRKAMAGACWQLTLQFIDGTRAFALFEMRR